jgi:choline dehydrogenase-like flavoprotein
VDAARGGGACVVGRARADRNTRRRAYFKAALQLKVAKPPQSLQQTFIADWLAAAQADGLPDAGGRFPVGRKLDFAWENRLAVDTAGRRQDACTAYLKPVIAQGGACVKNLQLIQGAAVTKVRVAGGRAMGVDYLNANGAAAFVAATREVVVSAGPYKSAQLLQLSGIGPADLLKRIGVPLVKDLPVGRGTTGRPITFQVYSYSGVPLARENDRSIVTSQAAKPQFLAGNGGVLGVGLASANARWRRAGRR